MKRSRAALFLFLATLALSLNAIGAANMQLSLAADVTPAPHVGYCPWTPRNPAPKPAPLDFDDVLGASRSSSAAGVDRDARSAEGSSCDDFDCRSGSTYRGGGCFEGDAEGELAEAAGAQERDAAPIDEYDYGYDDSSSAYDCGEDFDCGRAMPVDGNVGNLAGALSRFITVVQDVAGQLNLENEGLAAAAKATGRPALELPASDFIDDSNADVDEYGQEYGDDFLAPADNDGHADDLPAADVTFIRQATNDDHPADLPQAEDFPALAEIAVDAETGYAYDEIGDAAPSWDRADGYAEEEYAADHALDLPVGEDLGLRHPGDLPASEQEEIDARNAADLPAGEDLVERESFDPEPIYCPDYAPAVDADVLRPALRNVSSLLEVMSRGLSEASFALRQLSQPRVPPVSPIPEAIDPWSDAIGRRPQSRDRIGL